MKRELDNLVVQMYASGITYEEAVREFRRRYIQEVLRNNKGNQCKAARELGVHRNTLSRIMAELELDPMQIKRCSSGGATDTLEVVTLLWVRQCTGAWQRSIQRKTVFSTTQY